MAIIFERGGGTHSELCSPKDIRSTLFRVRVSVHAATFNYRNHPGR